MTTASSRSLHDLTVVIPVRNAERLIDDCLRSVLAARPKEVIIVDGLSTDGTRERVARCPVRLLSDNGAGLPAARRMGVEAATTPLVALVDADVVLGPHDLERLLDEFEGGGYTALQAGLHSVSVGPGYWGRALAFHHRFGRSRRWFGVVATIFERDAFLEHDLDDRFSSGEDIDLRWRLREAGCRIGVSDATTVEHRFEDDFAFARGQWLADGEGLGRMVASRGARAALLLALPAAAAVRGIGLSIARLQPRWIPYFLCYLAYNYAGMTSVLRRRGALGT